MILTHVTYPNIYFYYSRYNYILISCTILMIFFRFNFQPIFTYPSPHNEAHHFTPQTFHINTKSTRHFTTRMDNFPQDVPKVNYGYRNGHRKPWTNGLLDSRGVYKISPRNVLKFITNILSSLISNFSPSSFSPGLNLDLGLPISMRVW